MLWAVACLQATDLEQRKDFDQDGHASVAFGGEDCRDDDPNVSPTAPERCNQQDDDCDGEVDEGEAVDGTVWYEDRDGDGHGGSREVLACEQPAGTGATNDDCEDQDATRHPGATEIRDRVDQDCDGLVDEGVEGTLGGRVGLLAADGIVRGERDDVLGWAAAVSDVDGDGITDLLLASSAGYGRVHVVSGAHRGDAKVAGVASLVLEPPEQDELFPSALTVVGDVDGDGVNDVAARTDQGLRLWSLTLDSTFDEGRLLGGDELGVWSVTSLDSDADGGVELLLTAAREDGGEVLLVDGLQAIALEDAIWAVPNADTDTRRLYDAYPIGDFDGDGYLDIAVSTSLVASEPYVGELLVYLGPFTGIETVEDADLVLVASEEPHDLGVSVARLGAVDDAAGDELALGALPQVLTDVEDAAVWFVSYPGPGRHEIQAVAWASVRRKELDSVGWYVTNPGDVQGDGALDVAMGSGSVVVGPHRLYTVELGTVPGPADTTVEPWSVLMAERSGGSALEPLAAGDVNADGLGDLWILDPYCDVGGEYAGAAYLLLGSSD